MSKDNEKTHFLLILSVNLSDIVDFTIFVRGLNDKP